MERLKTVIWLLWALALTLFFLSLFISACVGANAAGVSTESLYSGQSLIAFEASVFLIGGLISLYFTVSYHPKEVIRKLLENN